MIEQPLSASELRAALLARKVTAVEIVEACLSRIRALDPELNCFTHIAEASARAKATEIDARRARGEPLGRLAGVPFGVKDLFDVKGETTKAGAKLRETAPPACSDADLVSRLKAADAVYLGRLNMDEFAYGFATVNANYGTTCNPYDTSRLAGGSSGGSAAAVAAGLVPIALGSDTNGSVRVPASLCGLFGLRPSHGTLPMSGVFPFIEQFDTVGPFTRTIEETATTYRVMAGSPPPAHTKETFRVARLGGWFRRQGNAEGNEAVDALARAFGEAPIIDLSLAEAARSAAFLLTAKYGGLLHKDTLQTHAMDYDPEVRDRLIAGLVFSDHKLEAAKNCIRAFNQQVRQALSDFDLLIAPSTPSTAPPISGGLIEIDGVSVSARANLGLFTQPLSVSGVPILSVPLKRIDRLPLGVQLIANKSCEEDLFSAAEYLVRTGQVGFTPPEAVRPELAR